MKIEGGITVNSGVKIGNYPVNAPIAFALTLTSSTTVNIPANATLLNASMLLIGSGGGGGWINTGYSYDCAGGGGAGGYIYVEDLKPYITPGTVYTITVGGVTAAGTNGANSSAFGFTAYGGGKGGMIVSGAGVAPGNGGSGGGSPNHANQFIAPGTGVAGQGYGGGAGTGLFGGGYAAGGGGGAGGSPPSSGMAETWLGGAGVINSITGSPIVYCEGGGGMQWVQSTYTRIDGIKSSTYGSGGAGTFASGSATQGNSGVCILKYTYILQ